MQTLMICLNDNVRVYQFPTIFPLFAMDLITHDQVQVIVGPQTSAEAQIVAQVCSRAHVPMVSFSVTLPSFCPMSVPYFVRATLDDSMLARPIASFVHLYGWRNVVLVVDDSDYGGSICASLISAFQEVDVIISDYVMVPNSASDDRIDAELYKLKTQQTRVFIVHMMSNLASRVFMHAAKAGMMSKGCSWIVTNSVTAVLETLDQDTIDVMQGIIGFRPYVPNSRTKSNFVSQFKTRFRRDHLQSELSNPTVYELWVYDAIWSIANAAEKIAVSKSPYPMSTFGNSTLTCFRKLAISETGWKYLNIIRNTQFSGLSGEFRLVRGQLQVSAFEIVNVIGKGGRVVGFWTEEYGLTRALNTTNDTLASSSRSLRTIIWPGDTVIAPRGFAITTSRSTLQIAVPNRKGIDQLVNSTDKLKVSGYCIDVFDAVMRRLPYYVSYEYIPVVTKTYDELITMLYRKDFDAVVGDVTILANRSNYVDFAFSYTEPGISMIVAYRKDNKSSSWIFLKPLTSGLWVATLCFILFTGFVVWVIEHRINPELRGNPSQQLGITLYFSFSALFFSQREKLESNLSRFLVVVWLFVVLILTSSYTASFSSMLTVQQLQPTATNVNELLRRGDYVGFQSILVWELLVKLGFNQRRLINYTNTEQYAEALNKGSAYGGVAAIFDEIPYIKLFLSNYCADEYAMVGPIYDSNGFGFAFPKGSSLGSDISRATLQLKESDEMAWIKKKWFDNSTFRCGQQVASSTTSLPFDSFSGLFIITGIVSGLMLVISLCTFILNERDNLQFVSASQRTISQKLLVWFKYYYQNDASSLTVTNSNEMLRSGGGVAEENQNTTSMENTPSIEFGSPNSSTEDMQLASLQETMLNPEGPIIHETMIE